MKDMSPLWKQKAAALLLTALLLLAGAPGLEAAGDEEDYRLPNGLKVVFLPRPAEEMLFVQLLVKAGSGHESQPEEYGLAHLMEHMAFKGSPKRPVGRLSPLIENNGGTSNAYTSKDETVYFLNMPPEKAELALDILADMVFNPSYDPVEYQAEKEVIVEEIKVYEDSPGRSLGQYFSELLFPAEHPYHHPTLGSAGSVRGVSRETALAFKDKHYRPDNMVLLVKGPIDAEALKPLVRRHFGAQPRPAAPLPPALAPGPGPARPGVKIIRSEKVTLPKVVVGYQGLEAASNQAPALELAAAVLGGGKSARLPLLLKDKLKLVSSVSCSSDAPKLPGVFSISFEAEAAHIRPAVETVFQELERLVQAGPEEDEIKKAKNQLRKSFLSFPETMYFGYGMQLAHFENRFGDRRFMEAWTPWLASVSGREISQALAGTIRNPAHILVLLPADQELDLTEAELRQLAAKAPKVPAETGKAKNSVQSATLACGARLLVISQPGSPLVTVRAGVSGGLSAEPEGRAGLVNLLTKVWALSGRDTPDLNGAAEELGGQISGFSSHDHLGLSAVFLPENLDKALPLFCEALIRPLFRDEDAERAKLEAGAALKRQRENLSGLTRQLMHQAVFEGGAYSRNPLGDAESLKNITAAQLSEFHRDQVRPERLLIVVSGEVGLKETTAFFNQSLNGSGLSGPLKFEKKSGLPDRARGPVDLNEPLNRAQTHTGLAFPAPDLASAERAALEVLSAHLSGLSGPLFRQMRDERSLAYRVSADYQAYADGAMFGFRISTDPEKTAEALACFERIIAEVKERELSGEELEGAKVYLISQIKTRRHGLSARNGRLFEETIAGLGEDFHQQHLEAIEKVTPAEVRAAAEKYLKAQDRSRVTVGGGAGAGKP